MLGGSGIRFGGHGLTDCGVAVRRESPSSNQHDHVEDSMIVAPGDLSLLQ